MLELNNQQHFLKNLFPHNDYVPLNITSTFQVCLFVCFRSLNHTHMRSSRDYSTLVGVMVKYFTQFPQFYLIMALRIFFSFRALFPNILEPAGVSQISLEHFHPPPPAATSPRCLFKPTSLSFNKFITEQTPRCFFFVVVLHLLSSGRGLPVLQLQRNPLILPFLVINIHQDGNLVNSCVYG